MFEQKGYTLSIEFSKFRDEGESAGEYPTSGETCQKHLKTNCAQIYYSFL